MFSTQFVPCSQRSTRKSVFQAISLSLSLSASAEVGQTWKTVEATTESLDEIPGRRYEIGLWLPSRSKLTADSSLALFARICVSLGASDLVAFIYP